MRAVVYHGPGQKAWEEVPMPVVIDDTDAIVRVDAATICGTDLHILKGDVPAVTDGRILGPRTQVLKAKALDSEALAARLAQDPDVEWAVVDYRRFALSAPNDPLYPQGLTFTTPVVGQWYLRAPGGTGNRNYLLFLGITGGRTRAC